MSVLDKEPSQIGTSQSSNQVVTLNDSDKPSVKTKQEVEQFTEPAIKERSSNLNDPKQVRAIYHYLRIVADKNYSDKDRVAAAEHLAIHYFKRPIYSMAWFANKSYITKELKGPGKSRIKYKERIKREITCLFLSIDVMEKGQGKRDAVEAVRNKLNKEMLIDLLGEGWRNKPRRAEIMALGIIGAGIRGETKAKRIIKESGIYRQQIIDKTNLSEFQRNVVSAIKRGMRATEYAKLLNIRPERVRKEHQRARDKMKQTLEGLNKDK